MFSLVKVAKGGVTASILGVSASCPRNGEVGHAAEIMQPANPEPIFAKRML